MLVTCPSCEASYDLSAEALGAGRRVRCSRCKNDWFAEGVPTPIVGLDDAAAIDMVESSEAIEAETIPVEPRAASRPKRRLFRLRGAAKENPRRQPVRAAPPRKRIRIKPTAMFAALSVAALAAAVVERTEIVKAAPSLASLYSAIGFDVNVRGLAIADVRSVEQIDEGMPLLLVTGSISNVSKEEMDVPRLRLAVTSGDDRELYAWTTVAGRPKLPPGETTTFRARLASPPADGQTVAVRFLARQDLAARASR